MAAKNFGNSFAEIYKRVPPNQMKQFIQLREKNSEYKLRGSKFPEHLPKIDWDYYRKNVRTDYVKMVDEFEKKYEEFGKVFDSRDKVDTKKYYEELDKMKLEVKEDIDKYIAQSNERIKAYESEIEKLRNMIPVSQMTCEEFCENFPERAPMLGVGQPSFWPHLPNEQIPGPADPYAGHEEDDDIHVPEAPVAGAAAAAAVGAEATVAAAGAVSTDVVADATVAKVEESAEVKSAATAKTLETEVKTPSQKSGGEVEQTSKKDGDPKTDGVPKTDGDPKKDGDKKS